MAKATAEDFAAKVPKVVGLAVHNAKRRHELAIDKAASDPVLAYEGRKWVAWGVLPHCAVTVVGSAERANQFAGIASKDNLEMLAARYGFIGFVTSEPKRKGKSFEYVTVGLPKRKGVQS